MPSIPSCESDVVYRSARDAYFDLGLVYEQHQLFDQAEAVHVKGIAVNPNDGPLHAVLGQTYQDAGKNDLAMEQFRLAAASLAVLACDRTPDRPKVAQIGDVMPTILFPPNAEFVSRSGGPDALQLV